MPMNSILLMIIINNFNSGIGYSVEINPRYLMTLRYIFGVVLLYFLYALGVLQ